MKKLLCLLLAIITALSPILMISPITAKANDGGQTIDFSQTAFPALDAVGSAHPRLYLDGGNLQLQKEKLNDPRYTKYTVDMFRILDSMIAFPPPDYNPAGDIADGFLRRYSMNMVDMAFAYKVTNDPKYLAAAEAWLTKGLNFPYWGRQAGVINADLAAGHMLHSVSLVYDWCYSDLKPETKQLAEQTLLARGEDMYNASLPDSQSFWRTGWLQNHMWINLSGLTAAGVVLYDKYPETAGKWLAQSRKNMHESFIRLGDDGASHEGVGYWQYGVEWLMNYMDISRQYFGVDYYTNEWSQWFKKTADYAARFFLPEDSITNQNNRIDFGDDDRNFNIGWGPSPNFSKLAMEYNDGYAQYYARMLRDKDANVSKYLYQFLLRTDLDIPEKAPDSLPTAGYFDDMELISSRSSWNGNESLLGFKSGPYMGHKVLQENNTNPYVDWGAGHAHPDQNHFTWFGGGDWLMVDDGYSYKYTSSHNTLLINGKGQAGEDSVWLNGSTAHAAAANDGSRISEIRKAEFHDDYDYMVGDATSAYSSALGLEKFNRHMIYIKPDVLVVIDDIKLKQESDLELRFFPESQDAIQLSDGSILVQNPNTRMLVQPIDTDGGAFDKKVVDYWGGRGNISASPIVPVNKLSLIASKKTNSWTNAVAISYAPNGQLPPKIESEKMDAGKYKIKVNGIEYTIDITSDTVACPEQKTKTDPITVRLDNVEAAFAHEPALVGNKVYLPLDETLEKLGKTIDTEIGGMTINGVKYVEISALRKAADTVMRWRDNVNAIEISTDMSGNSPEAKLAAISVSGKPLQDFSPDVYEYNIHKQWKDEASAVISLATDLRAAVETRFEADRVVIKVTSANRQNTQEYVLHIIPYLGFGEIPVKSITASSYNQEQIPELTMDDDLLSYWAAEGDGQFIQFELAGVYEVGQVAIAHHQGQVRYAMFKIEGSQDGESWTELYNGRSSGISNELEFYPVSRMASKYIRITGYGNSANKWNSYREVCFFGTEPFVRTLNLTMSATGFMEGEEIPLKVSAVSSLNEPIEITADNLTFEFSEPGIVEIADGVVRGLKPGTTNITAVLEWNGKIRKQALAVTVYSNILYESDFEDQVAALPPTGWKINNSGGENDRVTIGETDKGKGVKVNITTGGANPSARYALGNITGEVTIEADFMITKSGGDKQIQIYDSEPRLLSYLADFAANGNIMIWNSTAVQSIGTYELNKWYRMKFEVDTDTKTFNVYVDGVLKKANAGLRKAAGGKDFNWSKGLTEFRIDAYSAANTNGEYFMDNLKISVPRFDERPSYDVSFESNGGSAVQAYTVKSGSYIQAPADPVKNGQLFAGWYKDSQLTAPWSFDTDKVKGNVALYAKWKNELVVEVHVTGYGDVLYKGSDGLAVLPWPVEGFKPGDTVVLEAVPQKKNSFISWVGDAAGNSQTITLTMDKKKEITALFTSENKILLDEDFEGVAAGAVPAGWKFNNTGGANNQVSLAATDKGNSMKIVYATGGTNPSATYDLGYAKGKVIIEADYMVTKSGGDKQIQIYDSEPRLLSYLADFQANGTLTVYDGTRVYAVAGYNLNTWYNIRFEIDTDTKTYSIYINDALIKDQIKLRVQAGNKEFDLSNGLRQFRIDTYSAADTNGEFYMDNLLIRMPQADGSPDTAAPVTTAALSPEQPDGQNNWYVRPVVVSLTAQDNLSGVAKSVYSLDGGTAWQPYTAPVTFNQDGSYTVMYRSADYAGNMEPAKTATFRIDRTAPAATVAYSGTGADGQVTATLAPSEPVTITNNGGSSSRTFYFNGSFTFEFADAAGNTGQAEAVVNSLASASTGKPAIPVLSNDNGQDTGILDGNYTITMNTWWGNNGRVYKLYENDVLIDTQILADQAPGAQSTVTAITYRVNGLYRYYAELANAFGTSRSDVLTVNVTQAAPAKPVISNDNWDGDGNFKVSMNLWWGTNGTMYRLYENGVLIDEQTLTDASPRAQSAATLIQGRPNGTYEYRCELVNDAGAASSETMVVQVNR